MSDASISGVSLPPAAEASRHRSTARWGYALLLPFTIVAMELGVSLIEPRVLSLRNITNILVQSSYLLLFASAQMVVILTGGFDLSLGMAVSVISVATALATTGLAAAGAPAWLIFVAGLGVGLSVGLLVGAFNGLFVSWVGVNPFVVTLGSLNICYGLATTISGGRPVFNVPDAFTRPLYDGTFIPGIPIPVALAIAVAILLYLLLDRTVFGRALYLIGNNPRAANLAGIPQKRYLFLAYVTCSLLAAFGYHAHGTHRFGRAESRRQPDAREHRRRRDRRCQPARRRRRHRSGGPRFDFRHHAVQRHGLARSRRLRPTDLARLRHNRRDLPRPRSRHSRLMLCSFAAPRTVRLPLPNR